MPVTRGEHKVSPLKINYISLLNLIEEDDFDLTKAADIIQSGHGSYHLFASAGKYTLL